MTIHRSLVFALCMALTPAGVLADVAYRGVNLSGGEFGKKKIPGRYGIDYIYPGAKDVDYFQRRGMNIFRIPFLWERLQPEPMAALDSVEAARLDGLVQYIASRGGTVVLDLHNYARHNGRLLGRDLPAEALADLWRRVGALYRGQPDVFFGIMNEPHGLPGAEWAPIVNHTINAIRAVAGNRILVSGTAWSGAHSWNKDWYGVPNAASMRSIVDPAGNTWIEVHQYLDGDSSGTSADCVSPAQAAARLADFTEWLRETNNGGFLGEFAGGDSEECTQALDAMLAHLQKHSDVWSGWTYWSGGPWWGDYMFTLSPDKSGADRPQLVALLKYLWSPPSPPPSLRIEMSGASAPQP